MASCPMSTTLTRWNCLQYINQNKWYNLAALSTTYIGNHLEKEHQIHKRAHDAAIQLTMLDPHETPLTVKEFLEGHAAKSRATNLSKFKHDMTMWICTTNLTFINDR